jgi:hypothetical protein
MQKLKDLGIDPDSIWTEKNWPQIMEKNYASNHSINRRAVNILAPMA